MSADIAATLNRTSVNVTIGNSTTLHAVLENPPVEPLPLVAIILSVAAIFVTIVIQKQSARRWSMFSAGARARMLADRFGYGQAQKPLMNGWHRRLWFKFYRRWVYKPRDSSFKEYRLRYWNNTSIDHLIVQIPPPSKFQLFATNLRGYTPFKPLRELWQTTRGHFRNKAPQTDAETGISPSPAQTTAQNGAPPSLSQTPATDSSPDLVAPLAFFRSDPLDSNYVISSTSPDDSSEADSDSPESNSNSSSSDSSSTAESLSSSLRDAWRSSRPEARRAAALAWQPDQTLVTGVLEAFTLAQTELRKHNNGTLPDTWDLTKPENLRVYEKISAIVTNDIFQKRLHPKDGVQQSLTERAKLHIPFDDFLQWTKSSHLQILVSDLCNHGYGLSSTGTKSINPVDQGLWFSQNPVFSAVPRDGILSFFQEKLARFEFWEPPVANTAEYAAQSQVQYVKWAEKLNTPYDQRSPLPALLSLTLWAMAITPDNCPHPSIAGTEVAGRDFDWCFGLPTTSILTHKPRHGHLNKTCGYATLLASNPANAAVEVPFSRHGGPQPGRLFVDLKKISMGDGHFIGNEIRNTGILGLMIGEPQLKIPRWPHDLDDVLLRIANPPMGENCPHGPDTALRQTKVLAAIPDTMHCSAYTLAQLLTVAARFRRMEYFPLSSKMPYLSELEDQWLPEVPYDYEDISDSNILDTGVTYGIRVNFAQYWKALSQTPTKWYQTPDDKTLVAVSAWGTTRMSQEAGSLLLELAAPQSARFDFGLFGNSVFLPVEGTPNVEAKNDMIIRETRYLSDMSSEALEKIYPKKLDEGSLLMAIWTAKLRDMLAFSGDNWVLHMPAGRFVNLKETIAELVADSGLPRGEDYFTKPIDYASSGRRLHADCLAIVKRWTENFKVSVEYAQGRSPSAAFQSEPTNKFDIHLSWLGQLCFMRQLTPDNEYLYLRVAKGEGRNPPSLSGPYALNNHSFDRWVCFLDHRRNFESVSYQKWSRWAAIEMVARIGALAPYIRPLPLVADTIRPWDFKTAYLV